MEKTKAKWFYPSNNCLPKGFESVLISSPDFEDIDIGMYDSLKRAWYCPTIRNFVDVTAWAYLPEKPLSTDCPFVFRTAAEARYLTDIAAQTKSKNSELDKFIEVRCTILNATSEAKTEISVNSDLLTDNIKQSLKDAGFELNGNIISWKKGE